MNQFNVRVVSEKNMIAYIEDVDGKRIATILPHSVHHTDRQIVIGMVKRAIGLLNAVLLDKANQEYCKAHHEMHDIDDDRPYISEESRQLMNFFEDLP